MIEENPYAAPVDDCQPLYHVPPEGQFWRRGKLLVLEPGARPPARCVHCNAAANVALAYRQFHYRPFWRPRGGRTATILIGMCRRCRLRRRFGNAAAFMLVLAGLIPIILVDTSIHVEGTLRTAVLLISSALVAVGIGIAFRLRSPYARYIDDQEIQISGIGRAYLAELPGRN